MKVIGLWSGGKDSCFACYKAMASGYEVLALFNFTQAGGEESLSHGLPSEAILKQAELTKVPILQKAMPKEVYRDEFKKLITEWKNKAGIRGIIFGDIYLQEHKDWIDRVCRELEVEAILPLWGRDTKELILEIVNSGFKAVVVSTRADLLGREWLGRKVDKRFIKELSPEIDPCGEKGEFHTFVYDSPIFRKPVEFVTGKKMLKNNHWFLEVIFKGK
ncbi:MAG: diphthine--ammonia ligase [Candidatus Omnitrophica bacterium]|nr:diphthine--ammonia ligase [Candidatus Omnitrophota bacterium]